MIVWITWSKVLGQIDAKWLCKIRGCIVFLCDELPGKGSPWVAHLINNRCQSPCWLRLQFIGDEPPAWHRRAQRRTHLLKGQDESTPTHDPLHRPARDFSAAL